MSGSIYVIRREDLQELPHDVLLDDMFVPLGVLKRRKRVTLSHDAQAYYDLAYGDDQEFGRKVRTLAGKYQLVAKLPRLLIPSKTRLFYTLAALGARGATRRAGAHLRRPQPGRHRRAVALLAQVSSGGLVGGGKDEGPRRDSTN